MSAYTLPTALETELRAAGLWNACAGPAPQSVYAVDATYRINDAGYALSLTSSLSSTTSTATGGPACWVSEPTRCRTCGCGTMLLFPGHSVCCTTRARWKRFVADEWRLLTTGGATGRADNLRVRMDLHAFMQRWKAVAAAEQHTKQVAALTALANQTREKWQEFNGLHSLCHAQCRE